jgi:hypothetical protein
VLEQLDALEHSLTQRKAVGLRWWDAEIWRWDWSFGDLVE